MAISDSPDFKQEGREVEVRLIRALAMGGKRSSEIQLLLDSQIGEKANFQALSLLLADISVQEKKAQATFVRLHEHQTRMREELGRPVGIKTAAMDYLENIERALNLKDDEQALTYVQLAQMAFQDQLSGLANFRYFTRRFHEEIKRADRYGHLVSLLLLDIDHFKKFNDTHGHPAGNKALEHLAGILSNGVRETDLVARYGGEEFAIILPETTKYEAFALGQVLRGRIESHAVDIGDDSSQRITVSLGLATYPRDARSADALLSGADGALYASKAAGRNRISAFIPETAVHFTYKPDMAGSAQSISVVGDFNGWNKSADPMYSDDKRTFNLTMNLAPGRYSYKFVINGEWYITDPHCSQFVHDGFGGRNSVVQVKEN
jgi:diguanylate cyclase (GGDEF)-like protein